MINKEINNKINILSNINKLTNTLSMISMSKMNKYYKFLFYLKIFYKENKNIFFDLFISSKLKNNCLIIITTNKGLCGNINNEIFKKVFHIIKNNKFDIYVVGKKGLEFFKKKNFIIKQYIKIDNPTNLFFPKKILLKLRTYKTINFINSSFENNSINVSVNNILLKKKKTYIEYIKLNYNSFLEFYFNNSFKYFYLENYCCELKSRMITMKSAFDNSKKIIKNMKILKNKIRQFKVTKDMLEIINGNLC